MRINSTIVDLLPTRSTGKGKAALAIATLLVSGLFGGSARAVPIIWIDDAQNRLGTVDVGTGAVSFIGQMGRDTMTDIAFDGDGKLWGISFTGTYRIDKLTAEATLVGAHGIPGGNALVFGLDGTLYAAGFNGAGLYSISTTTGGASLIGNSALLSNSADLAFNQGQMYMSNTLNQLIRVDSTNPGDSSLIGDIGFPNVWGIATANDGNLYGAGNTTIIKIDPSTGAGTFLRDYSGGALGRAYGTAFITEALPIPEPSTFVLLVAGALALAARMRHSRT